MVYNGSSVMKLDALLNGKGMMEEIIPAELAADVNQEYRNERTAKRDNIDPSNVYEVVLEKLKEFNKSWREPDFASPGVSSLSAEENCRKAIELISLAETQRINGDFKWEVNAELAAEHAYGAYSKAHDVKAAEVEHVRNNEEKQEPVRPDQQPKPIPEVKTLQSKPDANKPWTLPFADVTASVANANGMHMLCAIIGGVERKKSIQPVHSRWYLEQPDKQKAALQLAMHYFGNSVFAAQRRNYEKSFMDRGRMPYDIVVTKAKPYATDTYHCPHLFFVPGSGKSWSFGDDIIPRQDYADFITGKKSATQIAIDNFGPKLLQHTSTAEEMMKQMGMTEPFNTEKGLQESIDFSTMMSEGMLEGFGQTFGAAALEVVVGGTHNIVGMGGTDTSLNRKPDENDQTTYQAMKPSKKKGGFSM